MRAGKWGDGRAGLRELSEAEVGALRTIEESAWSNYDLVVEWRSIAWRRLWRRDMEALATGTAKTMSPAQIAMIDPSMMVDAKKQLLFHEFHEDDAPAFSLALDVACVKVVLFIDEFAPLLQLRLAGLVVAAWGLNQTSKYKYKLKFNRNFEIVFL